MKIGILTQYYPPETGAPQNRLHSLAKYLKKNDHEVSVVTALPNYPRNKVFEEYKGKLSVKEIIDNVPVSRTWIYVGQSRAVLSRLLNYFSFVITSFFRLLFMPRTEVIICESPPLFLGITAVMIAKLKRSKLVFNVSDLWPESAERLNIINSKWLLGMAYSLERWIYRHSFLISGQTQGIVENIKARFPKKRVVWFPNGVDLTFWQKEHEAYNWRSELGITDTEFVILYAGIIGHAQGLEIIPQAAQLLFNRPVKFIMVGDGPEKEKLISMVKDAGLSNVLFVPNQSRDRIPSLINMCNAFLVPLKKLDLFKGAIPSKLFEPLAMRKPVLLGVDGEARELFINQAKGGLYYEPENVPALVKAISQLIDDHRQAEQLGSSGFAFVNQYFNREKIHESFLKEIAQITA
ncbi:MAG: glycosyltransferase family 4 protein [Cyclobacteriaceae bacterium]|nr:glycosyltransferase family 4 protein [Cyclobacteriaceae bacterium]UYN85587.1 MAG: glycosyltransferase family 4 protein [Cyclobacteriaceae bacterium]